MAEKKSNNKNDKKGLASADEKTKERVAREGGKASHKGSSSKKK
jgi:hypothetical protein